MGVMIICLLGIFASAEMSFDVEDGDTPPESLLAKSTAVVPTEEMVTGGPAPPPPPPPDPAALAMAMAMKEKAQKGQEKTTKKMRESARKSKKREAWRKRQAAKLAKIKNEANAKIAKEAKHKAKLVAFQHKKELGVKAKQMKIKEKVKKLKAASMVKVKKLRAKNKLTKARMNTKMAALKKSSKEKNTKLTSRVKAEIAIKQAKAHAKRQLTLAKITAETATKKAAVQAKFLKGKKAIDDHYAKIALSREKEAQTKKTFKGLLAAKSAKHKQALAAEDQNAAKKRAVQVAKEGKHKSRMIAAYKKKIALSRAGHFPGGARILRFARREKKLVRKLKRAATRRARAQVVASRKKFRAMQQKATKAVVQLSRAELHVMRKVSKGARHNKASNIAVSDAWSLAMGQKPSKPQAEALRLVKEERDTPSTDLLAAWKMAVGKHLPKAPTGTKPAHQTVQAFSDALEASPHQEAKRNAQESLRAAWGAAVGHTSHGVSAAVAEALHFAPTAVPPPQVGAHALAPSEEVDASLAAGAAVRVIPGGAPVLKSGGGWKAHGDADPEDAAKEAMQSVLVRAHEMAKPVVAVNVKPKAKHSTKSVKPKKAVKAKASRSKSADPKSEVHVEPLITAKKHVAKAKRSAAIMAKLKQIEGLKARMMLHGKKKAAHKAATTVVGTAMDLEAVKAAPSQLKKKPSDLVEEGKAATPRRKSGAAATKAQGFGVAVALAVAAMLCQ